MSTMDFFWIGTLLFVLVLISMAVWPLVTLYFRNKPIRDYNRMIKSMGKRAP